jgi:hypothetical protein
VGIVSNTRPDGEFLFGTFQRRAEGAALHTFDFVLQSPAAGDGQPPPEKWLPLLKRVRDGGKLCQLFVSAQGAHTSFGSWAGAVLPFTFSSPCLGMRRKIFCSH